MPTKYVRGHPFDASFSQQDTARRARHGQIWTHDELSQLKDLYHRNAPLRDMAVALERPADGVMLKLAFLRLVKANDSRNGYTCIQTSAACSREAAGYEVEDDRHTVIPAKPATPATPKEPEMAAISIQVLIGDVNAATLSDAELFKMISAREQKMTSLESIKNKPKKLKEALAALQAEIDLLVAYVDDRDAFTKVPSVTTAEAAAPAAPAAPEAPAEQ